MNARNCLLLIAVCGVSAAIAATPEEKVCHGRQCDITVTVNGCDDIVVDPDGLATDHAVNLRWTISTPNYEFVPDTGIQFDDPQFVVKHAPKPDQFHVHDNKSTTGIFHYKVHIEGCAAVDPYVRNY